MRAHGEATTADVLDLYDRAAALDPSHFRTQVERVRLARDSGDLIRAQAAATQALSVATTDVERAAALRLVGEIASDQHDYDVAKPALEAALAIFQRLAASDPTPKNQGDVALGAAGQGRPAGADQRLQRRPGRLLRQSGDPARLAAANPTDAALQDYIASDYQRLGDLDEKLGDLKGAKGQTSRPAWRSASKSRQPTQPTPTCSITSRPFCAGWATWRSKQGDLAGARKAYEDCLAIRQRLSAADPSSAQLQNAVALDLEDLAGVAFSQNDLAAARADYDACLAIRRRSPRPTQPTRRCSS
jgi:tetratricopeptide (TPR) repeat protein